jgi:hypothetical protein
VFLSHCLLNHNVRYLGGAEREAGVRAIVDRYLADGIGYARCRVPRSVLGAAFSNGGC